MFDKERSAKRSSTPIVQYQRGWSPIYQPVLADEEVYFKIIDWIGGEGDKPVLPTNPAYLGWVDNAFKIVSDINYAINIAEELVPKSYLTDISSLTHTQILTLSNYTNLRFRDLSSVKEGTSIIYHNIPLLSNNELGESGEQSGLYGATQLAIVNAINKARMNYRLEYVTLTNSLIASVEAT